MQGLKMWQSRMVHKLTQSLQCMGNILPCMCQKIELANQAPILLKISISMPKFELSFTTGERGVWLV